MSKHWERRDVLKTLAAGSAYAPWERDWRAAQTQDVATLVLRNGKYHHARSRRPDASAVAITDGRFVAVGDDKES